MATPQQMRRAQHAMLKHAIQIGNDHGAKLDYSERSVADVDSILMQMHDAYVHDTSKEENEYAVMGFAISLGAYLIEVIERTYGQGQWSFDETKEGKREAYPFTFQGQTVYPVDWCADAIAIGERENIRDKYGRFVFGVKGSTHI
jgi:hypothetical protein